MLLLPTLQDPSVEAAACNTLSVVLPENMITSNASGETNLALRYVSLLYKKVTSAKDLDFEA